MNLFQSVLGRFKRNELVVAPTDFHETKDSSKVYFRYQLHGAVIDSEIPLPNMTALAGPEPGPADVHIEFGKVPLGLTDCNERRARYQVSPTSFLIWFDGVARYLIQNGQKIIVEPYPNALTRTVAELLMAAPMVSLLLQRRVLVLNASAVATPEGAIMIIGRSIAGKSTIAIWLARNGFPFITDDVCTVDFDPQGTPFVNPGPARVRLLPEVANWILPPERQDKNLDGVLQKISLDVSDTYRSERMQIKKVLIIEMSGLARHEIDQTPVEARSKILMRHVYGKHLLGPMELQMIYRNKLETLANRIEMVSFSRDKAVNSVLKLGKLILKTSTK